MTSPASIPAYRALLARVKKTLLEGQQRIELERVKTYWQAGRTIHTHILKNKDRAEYGKEVIEKLAEDLKVEATILLRCRKFFQTYPRLPIPARGQEFRWSHYRILIAVADDKKRSQLEKIVAHKGWTAKELAKRIKQAKPVSSTNHQSLTTQHVLTPPKRGQLYTYTTFTPPEAFAVSGKVIADCGFDVWRQIKVREWPQAKIKKESDYTYRALVEKVIDGDTMWVNIDLGLGAYTRQKIRLRAIDCPELSSVAGQKAKAFVQKVLRGADTITIVTSKSDKYDRYLADVWVGERYLNQELLDEGLAGVWR